MNRYALLAAALLVLGRAVSAQAGIFSPSWWIDDLQYLYAIEPADLDDLPVGERAGPRLFSSSPVPFDDIQGGYMIGYADGSREYGYVEPTPTYSYTAGTGALGTSAVTTTPEPGNLPGAAGVEEIPTQSSGVIVSSTTISTTATVTNWKLEPSVLTLPASSSTFNNSGSTGLFVGGTVSIDYTGDNRIAFEPPAANTYARETITFQGDLQTVPEPSTVLLALVAALAAAAYAGSRRRR